MKHTQLLKQVESSTGSAGRSAGCGVVEGDAGASLEFEALVSDGTA